MTLIEAPRPRNEALAIALRLRKAAEEGQTAALITPDRMLTRQVGGRAGPLGHRARRQRRRAAGTDAAGPVPAPCRPSCCWRRRGSTALLALLKHPLTHPAADAAGTCGWTRELELQLRREGPPFPEPTT